MNEQVREVAPEDWVAAVTEVLSSHPWVDGLHAVDEIGRPVMVDGHEVEVLRVLCRLVDWDAAEGPAAITVQTRVPREGAELDSLAEVAPGLVWHERQAADFFGIHFRGGDPSPLLVHPGAGPAHPMRKDVVLAARVTQPWPGTKDPEQTAVGSRRRMAPAGVPDPEVWGARPIGDPAPAAEVAQALQGGRVRRRR